MKNVKSFFFGIVAGVINTLLGAGAGILIVPFLRSEGLSQKAAQATALSVILPLSAVSMLIYLRSGYFSLGDGVYFIPFGLIGVIAGVFLMGKIPQKTLSLIFYAFLLYSGSRMLFGR
ncbi:MAG: sulfite exporter TauE/SafE family protein [Clostridia bacterium]|nr:sulfite exporter TauE/SafE family protein [Clostridia bacterium]